MLLFVASFETCDGHHFVMTVIFRSHTNHKQLCNCMWRMHKMTLLVQSAISTWQYNHMHSLSFCLAFRTQQGDTCKHETRL